MVQIEDVAKQLLYNKPYVYKSTFSSSIGSTHPQLEKAVLGLGTELGVGRGDRYMTRG